MYDSSEDAEEAFYTAFSNGNLDAMMRVWATTSEIICIHPGGPRLIGIDDIRRSWDLIFRDSLQRAFTLRGRLIVGTGDQRVHVLEENIRVPGTTFAAPPVLATNVYQRHRHGWSMVLHHASVAPTALNIATAREDGEPPRLH